MCFLLVKFSFTQSLLCVCVCVCVYECYRYTGALEGRKRASHPLKLDLQLQQTGQVEIKLGLSGRIGSSLILSCVSSNSLPWKGLVHVLAVYDISKSFL